MSKAKIEYTLPLQNRDFCEQRQQLTAASLLHQSLLWGSRLPQERTQARRSGFVSPSGLHHQTVKSCLTDVSSAYSLYIVSKKLEGTLRA